jgi:phosphate starvation-inducible PhoH-like protein
MKVLRIYEMNTDDGPLCQKLRLDLSEELSRHIFSVEDNSGLNLIRTLSDLTASGRGNSLFLQGNNQKVKLVKRFLEILQNRIELHESLNGVEVNRLFRQLTTNESFDFKTEEIIATHFGRVVKAKTPNQSKYLEIIEKNTVTVALGPAGTGKTYLAAAMAVRALKDKKVSRVILSRPVVEAGESLGYLPGDLKEKVDPHFRPLYDSLQEFLGMGKFEQMIKQGIIEITPLAYMRGRTFNEAFVVLDEAQNTTMPQMRMFLTRLGYGSKMVVTGDHTQIDLPKTSDSSLLILEDILKNVESVGFIRLSSDDVIRHDVVRRIINAFDAYTNKESETHG